MKLSDLKSLSGREFHERYDRNHICKDDETIYFLIDSDNWLTICKDADSDDGLWRGEWDFKGVEFFDAYDGCKTPDEVLALLCLHAQASVAKAILAA